MNHGIILGSMQTVPELFVTDPDWINIKRAAGAHKIATYLRKQGWDIEVLDYWTSFDLQELKYFFQTRINENTKFIGISSTFPHHNNILENIKTNLTWFKQTYPHIPIIAGSKSLYVTRELPADYHVTGYGEKGVLELLKKLDGKESSVVINKLDNKNIVHCDVNHPCFPEKDLAVEYEDRDFIQPDEVLTLELSRGCKFKCKFCSYNVIGVKGDYTRDMESLYHEMLTNYEKWGVTSYSIADETVNDTVDKLKAVADQVKKLPFKPNMFGYVRGDLLASREDDKKYMAEMGLWGHYYGIESLNHKSAKTIGKGLRPEKLIEGLSIARDYFEKNVKKYRATFSMIAGLPYETPETLRNSMEILTEKFPKEAIMMFPLYLGRTIDINESSSEFSRTWMTSGDFHPEEMPWRDLTVDDVKQMGVDSREGDLSWPIAHRVLNNIDNPEAVRWKHDTMDWYSANIEWGKLISTKHFFGKGVLNWNLYNFVSSRYVDNYEEALKIKNNEINFDKLKDLTQDHIEDYKWKKLSL